MEELKTIFEWAGSFKPNREINVLFSGAEPHSLRSSLTQFDTRRARASIVFTFRPMVFVLRKAEILLSRLAPPGCTACTCSSMASPRRRTNIAGLEITWK